MTIHPLIFMNIKWEIITDAKRFEEVVSHWTGPIACDTETYGARWDVSSRKLLGVSLSNGTESVYISINYLSGGIWLPGCNLDLHKSLQKYLSSVKLIGHNFTYDKQWIRIVLDIETTWQADTRLMWHMASAPAGPRSYGLKDGQVELLGWEEKGDRELRENVESKGGKLSNGDHYMADLPILAKYACLDVLSTYQIYNKLSPFFDRNSYWNHLQLMMNYNELLERNSFEGVLVDTVGLEKSHKRLMALKDASRNRFFKIVKNEVTELERDYLDIRLSKLVRPSAIALLKATPERWEKFNLNSDKQKRELFYEKLKFPVTETTEGGLPSTSADAIKHINHPALVPYRKFEKAGTLTSNFTAPWLGAIFNSRINPGFNVCGTVSYRLSGFKPYFLNLPFDEKEVMKHFVCDKGFIGIHSDLSAIEPTITAHYSECPHLLKVFRDGLGDIYLDLALDLFPNDKELQNGYNPGVAIDKETKEQFKRQRKISKVIQLAVQYTGTAKTVARGLIREGIPTTVEEATGYVRAYHQKFKKVSQFEYKLREVLKKEGQLRNVIGRIIRVPDPNYKDLQNRFIQSSAHDILILWVSEIYDSCNRAGIDLRPILLDCHDSTSNQVPKGREKEVACIYQEALQKVTKDLELSVSIKCETKFFSTMAGLKGEE